MIIERRAIPALLAGAMLAATMSGCAWWNEHMRSNTASASTSEHRGAVQTASDATITAKVKTAMAADATVKARNIDVDTVRGVVQLNGNVGSIAERNRAMEIARDVSGVVAVRDNMKLPG